jgi:DNA polymerase I-like protein with 3'-5' exonuclease and polymerase domains/uracil-DNA glycosylase
MATYENFSSRLVHSRGPQDAKVLVVGEAPGEYEEQAGRAFVGSSGQELDRQLSEAKFITSAVRFTNAIPYRPFANDIDLAFASSKSKAELLGAVPINGRYCLPVAVHGLELLQQEIAAINPQVIIAVGGTALWATTGKEGISDWRGSTLSCIHNPSIPVVPTFHPANILRDWASRHLCVLDLKRANKILQFGPEPRPPWNFIIRPNFQMVMDALDKCEEVGEIAVDIETKRGYIVCVAFAWNRHDAVCVPIVDRWGQAYWSDPEELAIVQRIRRILSTHKIIGQNFHYDSQYFARRMLAIPTCSFDTMLAQHVLFPGTDKSLAHLSSLYCPYHVFWKDDGKEWNPQIHPEEQLWEYNCTDAVKTFEVMESQKHLIDKYSLQEQFGRVMNAWPHILMTMLTGVRVDPVRKESAKVELQAALSERQAWLNTVVGRPFNTNSPKQMQMFFADELGVKLKKGKKTKGISLDKKALREIGEKHTLLWPVVRVIEESRSLKVFLNTFAEAPLDEDGRMRCSYNQGGTETFRMSSSENAFGSGTNLQNIPSGNRSTTMKMPNMRELFVPDPGMEIAEIDLAGADAQVVAWDAGDEKLKEAFKQGLKIHVVNNKDMYGKLAGEDGKAEPYYTKIKQGVHLTNYCGKTRTMAETLNIKLSEAESFQTRWFTLHPAIPKWHDSIARELADARMVKNIFGYRRVYFDRIETILPQAVAWRPQSTIAIVANEIWTRLGKERNLPVQVLLQVHDSLVFQYPVRDRESVLRRVRELVRVVIPYKDPLIIPLGLKTSVTAWGHCKDCAWPE